MQKGCQTLEAAESSERAKAYLDAFLGLKTQQQVAQALQVSHQAVSQGIAPLVPVLSTEIARTQRSISEKVEAQTHKVLDRFEREFPGLSWGDAQRGSIASAIWIDKTQLLKGLPTEFILNVDLHRRDLTALMEKACRARRRLLGLEDSNEVVPDGTIQPVENVEE